MKNIFKYFGILLSVAMMGAVTACNIEEIDETADVGLGIKVFFPTKVVAGQPMTINGSGFADVREVVFPDGVKVTDFEIVGNDMIRVTAPSGIAAAGGNLIVRTADEEAVSRLPLTLGQTVVSGYSKQDGESIQGGEQLTIFGKDLEFISSVELLDPDGNPLVLQDEDFYRKGTSTIIINIPKKVFDGTFVGKVYTFDGKEFALPELAYEPASDGGHWEKVKTVIWKNPDPEGNGPANWNGTYRFGLDGRDGNNECIATFPQDVWDMIKGGTFYMLAKGSDWVQMRITTGWWSTTWTGNDIMTGDERIIDNGDGTYYIEINFEGDPILDALDEQHLLLTGSGFTPLEIYVEEDVWVDGGGHSEIVKTSFWKNPDPDGNGPANWNGTYRFGLDGHDGNNECIATFPQEVWDKIKTGTFYMLAKGSDWVQMRITTGWWSTTWTGNDIMTGDERIIDNGDGTYYIEINFGDDPIVGSLDEQHLLFTGSGFTPLELNVEEEIWVDGGDDTPKEVVMWEGDGSAGGVNWNGTYRFGLDGHDGNNECIATFPQDVWDRIKTGTFYMQYRPDGDSYQIRVTTGWWSVQWMGSDNDIAPWNMADRIIDNGDGTFHIEVKFDGDPIVDALDDQHLLFTGSGYTPLKLYYLE
ncbi:MAG: hypothetical protein IJL42_05470 [Bacteroidales bacterium]|nr:hypothetical protein [Bacteroidales bacterium]